MHSFLLFFPEHVYNYSRSIYTVLGVLFKSRDDLYYTGDYAEDISKYYATLCKGASTEFWCP